MRWPVALLFVLGCGGSKVDLLVVQGDSSVGMGHDAGIEGGDDATTLPDALDAGDEPAVDLDACLAEDVVCPPGSCDTAPNGCGGSYQCGSCADGSACSTSYADARPASCWTGCVDLGLDGGCAPTAPTKPHTFACAAPTEAPGIDAGCIRAGGSVFYCCP